MAQPKPAPSAKPLYGYKVHIQRYCEHSEREDTEYGSWSESYSNTFDYITKTDKYGDVYSPVDLEKQPGFLVWLEYSTGDSFGNSERGSVEVIALFASRAKAEELKKRLQDWTDKKNSGAYSGTDFDYNFKAKIDKQEIKIYAPWLGYFEHLDNIYIQEVSLK